MEIGTSLARSLGYRAHIDYLLSGTVVSDFGISAHIFKRYLGGTTQF